MNGQQRGGASTSKGVTDLTALLLISRDNIMKTMLFEQRQLECSIDAAKPPL